MPIPMTATEKALNISDLLELILLFLPESTLLTTAQLVCKGWHNHIVSSKRIQRALFFAPCSQANPLRLNPLLVQHFPIFFDNACHSSKGLDKLSFGARGRDSSPNKDAKSSTDGKQHEPKTSSGARGREQTTNDDNLTSVPDNRALRDKFLSPSASWRRMLLSQPYSEVPHWHHSAGLGCSDNSLDFRLKQPGHIHTSIQSPQGDKLPAQTRRDIGEGTPICTWTMGAVYDRAIAHSGSFRIFWDLQTRMPNHCQWTESTDSDPEFDSDPGPDARMSDVKVCVRYGDGVPERKIRLFIALKDHKAVFQTTFERYCYGFSRGEGIEPSSKRSTRFLERYYSFPGADLEAMSDSDWDSELYSDSD